MKRLFRLPSRDRDVSGDVNKELEFHIAERVRELVTSGVPADRARAEALAAFGDRAAIASELLSLRGTTVRRRRLRRLLSDARQDLRIAWRGLIRTPGFTATALLTLALGIGANSAVFSVVHSVLLRPLPYPAADRLVQLWTDVRARNGRTAPEWLTPPGFADWRDQNGTFSAMASYRGWGPALTGPGDPLSLGGLAVSGDFFRVFGVAPLLGRTLEPRDDDPGAEPVVVLSYQLWRDRFGAENAIINRQVLLDGQSWRVVGVMPQDFRAPMAVQPAIYRASRLAANGGCGRECIVLRAIGRLKPGVTFAQATADIGAIARRQAERYPASNTGVGAWLVPLHEQITGPTEKPLIALSVAVALVLLIGCVNLANLLLLRGARRGREVSLRTALGAGRGRILRQLMTENTLLALLGGIGGLLVGMAGSQALGHAVPASVRDIQGVDIDATVIAFTAGISLLAGLLFGLFPALRATGRNLMEVLRTNTSDADRRGRGVQQGLVMLQLALAITLLVGAGLLARSLLVMQRFDLGYRTEGVLLQSLAFPRAQYPRERIPVALNDVLTRLRANPAIRAAEVTDLPPLTLGDQDMTVVPLGEPRRGNTPPAIWYRVTSPGYLRLMHVRLVAGRYFNDGDRQGTAGVGIVNEEAARVLWGGKNPIGRTLAAGEDSMAPRLTVVGVVASDRQDGPREPIKSELFVPLGQVPSNGFSIVVEPSRSSAAAAAALRSAIHDGDPLLPVPPPVAMEQTVGDLMALPRLYAIVLGVFAAVALVLAVIGVYGVMGYVVAQREREIGVRLALGASPRSISRILLGRGLKMIVIGTAIGLALSVAVAQLARSLLFGVNAVDPLTLVAAPLVLGAAGLVACWLPARRAVRVDPLKAIRQE